ncbi:MAG: hypothetical protein KAI17_21895 [Thiotrichaceae bacterium]|nr:hypothetical protein [Thiotrichaceae bacterium]
MSHDKLPKMVNQRKACVEIHLIEGTILKGTVEIIGRTARLSDTLNNPDKEFLVLSDNLNNHHIINKRHILKVREIENV